jgi:hypothetical protein
MILVSKKNYAKNKDIEGRKWVGKGDAILVQNFPFLNIKNLKFIISGKFNCQKWILSKLKVQDCIYVKIECKWIWFFFKRRK